MFCNLVKFSLQQLRIRQECFALLSLPPSHWRYHLVLYRRRRRNFRATAVHTTQVYTERCFSDWQHHIKHALKWWWEHKRDLYENRVTQMHTPGAESATDPGTRKYSGQTSAHVHDGHISARCTQQSFSLFFQHRMLNNNRLLSLFAPVAWQFLMLHDQMTGYR